MSVRALRGSGQFVDHGLAMPFTQGRLLNNLNGMIPYTMSEGCISGILCGEKK